MEAPNVARNPKRGDERGKMKEKLLLLDSAAEKSRREKGLCADAPRGIKVPFPSCDEINSLRGIQF